MLGGLNIASVENNTELQFAHCSRFNCRQQISADPTPAKSIKTRPTMEQKWRIVAPTATVDEAVKAAAIMNRRNHSVSLVSGTTTTITLTLYSLESKLPQRGAIKTV